MGFQFLFLSARTKEPNYAFCLILSFCTRYVLSIYMCTSIFCPQPPNPKCPICDPSPACGQSTCSVQHAWQPLAMPLALLPSLAELLFPSVLVSETTGVAKHSMQYFPPPARCLQQYLRAVNIFPTRGLLSCKG